MPAAKVTLEDARQQLEAALAALGPAAAAIGAQVVESRNRSLVVVQPEAPYPTLDGAWVLAANGYSMHGVGEAVLQAVLRLTAGEGGAAAAALVVAAQQPAQPLPLPPPPDDILLALLRPVGKPRTNSTGSGSTDGVPPPSPWSAVKLRPTPARSASGFASTQSWPTLSFDSLLSAPEAASPAPPTPAAAAQPHSAAAAAAAAAEQQQTPAPIATAATASEQTALVAERPAELNLESQPAAAAAAAPEPPAPEPPASIAQDAVPEAEAATTTSPTVLPAPLTTSPAATTFHPAQPNDMSSTADADAVVNDAPASPRTTEFPAKAVESQPEQPALPAEANQPVEAPLHDIGGRRRSSKENTLQGSYRRLPPSNDDSLIIYLPASGSPQSEQQQPEVTPPGQQPSKRHHKPWQRVSKLWSRLAPHRHSAYDLGQAQRQSEADHAATTAATGGGRPAAAAAGHRALSADATAENQHSSDTKYPYDAGHYEKKWRRRHGRWRRSAAEHKRATPTQESLAPGNVVLKRYTPSPEKAHHSQDPVDRQPALTADQTTIVDLDHTTAFGIDRTFSSVSTSPGGVTQRRTLHETFFASEQLATESQRQLMLEFTIAAADGPSEAEEQIVATDQHDAPDQDLSAADLFPQADTEDHHPLFDGVIPPTEVFSPAAEVLDRSLQSQQAREAEADKEHELQQWRERAMRAEEQLANALDTLASWEAALPTHAAVPNSVLQTIRPQQPSMPEDGPSLPGNSRHSSAGVTGTATRHLALPRIAEGTTATPPRSRLPAALPQTLSPTAALSAASLDDSVGTVGRRHSLPPPKVYNRNLPDYTTSMLKVGAALKEQLVKLRMQLAETEMARDESLSRADELEQQLEASRTEAARLRRLLLNARHGHGSAGSVETLPNVSFKLGQAYSPRRGLQFGGDSPPQSATMPPLSEVEADRTVDDGREEIDKMDGSTFAEKVDNVFGIDTSASASSTTPLSAAPPRPVRRRSSSARSAVAIDDSTGEAHTVQHETYASTMAKRFLHLHSMSMRGHSGDVQPPAASATFHDDDETAAAAAAAGSTHRSLLTFSGLQHHETTLL